MKKTLTILLALIFSVMFSSPSFADWKKVDKSDIGNTYYVDFERLRKNDGYVYHWELTDLLEPAETGMRSAIIYKQGDCKLLRFRVLSFFSYNISMGKGTPSSFIKTPEKEWRYPPPNSSGEYILKDVCAYAK
jgi:hypothetical protein